MHVPLFWPYECSLRSLIFSPSLLRLSSRLFCRPWHAQGIPDPETGIPEVCGPRTIFLHQLITTGISRYTASKACLDWARLQMSDSLDGFFIHRSWHRP